MRDASFSKGYSRYRHATSARRMKIQGIFPKLLLREEDGTIVVAYKKEKIYEITTFRTEGTYSDRAPVGPGNLVLPLREDTLRRDFHH